MFRRLRLEVFVTDTRQQALAAYENDVYGWSVSRKYPCTPHQLEIGAEATCTSAIQRVLVTNGGAPRSLWPTRGTSPPLSSCGVPHCMG
jgi:hypothetical protein